jgi:hypothetical protein
MGKSRRAFPGADAEAAESDDDVTGHAWKDAH